MSIRYTRSLTRWERFVSWCDEHTGAIFVALGILFVLGISFGVVCCESSTCTTLAEDLRLEHKWSVIGGCRVKVGDRFVPLGNVRFLQNGAIQVEVD